jgi:hypothetical protein
MIRLPDQRLVGDAQRARDELSAAWEQLVSAAEHGAKRVERASRRRVALARERAAAVRRAARGERPDSPWRWLAMGVAAGVVIGAVGAVAVTRRGRTAGQIEQSGAGQATVAAVRERAGAAVHGATSATRSAAAAARDTVDKVREKISGDDDPEAGQPPATAPPRGSTS